MKDLLDLWTAYRNADAQAGGLLSFGPIVVAVLLAAIATPAGRGGGAWPRLWTCGTVGALAVLVLFIPR